jgi:hypothetical protein
MGYMYLPPSSTRYRQQLTNSPHSRTGSVPSIAAGITVGVLYNYGGYRIRNGQAYGVETALLASLVLAGSSFPRALKVSAPRREWRRRVKRLILG